MYIKRTDRTLWLTIQCIGHGKCTFGVFTGCHGVLSTVHYCHIQAPIAETTIVFALSFSLLLSFVFEPVAVTF